jgi:hypothetical protein
MFKTVVLLKRRPGMSREDFIAYYESRHAKLAEPRLKLGAVRYVRRYLQPDANPLTGEIPEAEYDVITEMWYPDRATFDRMRAALKAAPDVIAEIAADEQNLFDRSRNRFFFVEERESDLTPG